MTLIEIGTCNESDQNGPIRRLPPTLFLDFILRSTQIYGYHYPWNHRYRSRLRPLRFKSVLSLLNLKLFFDNPDQVIRNFGP